MSKRPTHSRDTRRVALTLLAGAVIAAAALSARADATRAAGPGGQIEVVIFTSGRRLVVSHAWQDGATMRLDLPAGGKVTIPAALVKRVSLSSADLPESAGAAVASSKGGGGGSGWSSYGGDGGSWSPPPPDPIDTPAEPTTAATSSAVGGRFSRPFGNGLRPGSTPRMNTPQAGNPFGSVTPGSGAIQLQRPVTGGFGAGRVPGTLPRVPTRAMTP